MDDNIRVDFEGPVDIDGFLRRECPTCEREFKWFAHDEGDPDAEPVDQCFCPLCGVAAHIHAWLTQAQARAIQELGQAVALRYMEDAIQDAFRGNKRVKYTPGQMPPEPTPPDELLHEPNDMGIVQSPCHPTEPIKVPDEALHDLHCLVCGAQFAVQ